MEAPPQKNSSPPHPQDGPQPPVRPPRSNSFFWLLAIVTAVVAIVYFASGREKRSEITYGLFRQQLDQENIASVVEQGSQMTGEFKKPPLDAEAPFQFGA